MPKLIKATKYPNLFRDPVSRIYYFRKYSQIKGRQFLRSTGEKASEARAYKLGIDAFNEWLGRVTDETGTIYFGKVAKRYLELKMQDRTLSPNTKRTFKNQFEASIVSSNRDNEISRPRLLDFFGHLPIEDVDADHWKAFINQTLELVGSYKFFNARKSLLEVLNYAHSKGYIRRVPNLDNPDEDAAPPRELKSDELRKLFKVAHYIDMVRGPNNTIVPRKRPGGQLPVRHKNWIKLVMFIALKQGARPGEIIQYRWDMIRWEEGGSGKIYIPASITKTRRARQIPLNKSVARILRFLEPAAHSAYIFASEVHPERPMGSYHKGWQSICARAGFHAEMYWFRDTFITRKIREGRSTVFIAKYTDTSSTMIEKKYAAVSEQDLGTIAD